MKVFLEYFDMLVEKCEIKELPEEVARTYDSLKASQSEITKPTMTEIGLTVLKYMQENNIINGKSKDIAAGMGISSRSVSGTMRKLVTEGYVSKFGSNPMVYSITDKGRIFDFEKENINNETHD